MKRVRENSKKGGAGMAEQRETRVVVLFGRRPERGCTKTRLAVSLGDDETLLLYRAMLADSAAKCLGVANRRFAALAGSAGAEELPGDPLGRAPFVPFRVESQQGDGFGARLGWSLARALEWGRPVVLIGADSPELTAGDLEEAFALLADHDVVLGPAADGGYYLVGLQRFEPALFEGITWSTDRVLAETVAVARARHLSVGLLRELADLDYLADLEALAVRRLQAWACGEKESPCPATDAWLQGRLPGQSGEAPLERWRKA